MNLLQPLENALGVFLSYIPQIIGAIIILVVGYIIAKVLQALVTKVLRSVGFEDWMERGGVKQFFDRASTRQTPSGVLGKVVFWFVFIIAITMAADALGLQQISGFLNQLIAYIPSIFVAILILLLAALLANFLASIVRGATSSDILASVVQYGVIIYAVFVALTQLGIAVTLTAPTFLILLGAVALALAIAFGIGGREVAKDVVEKAYNRRQVTEGNDYSSTGQQRFAFGDGGGERSEEHSLRRGEER
ncbi:MAG TPA: mechanosensitive ion channel [Rubrobacteraceae bacterium]|nr:mechanosensitive ion channel [Rubrobacteraceae bacterium]